MSIYFDIVSQSVADEGGTVDKFIGDGVMAFWGAPAELPDHALHACCGALRSVRRLDAINEMQRGRGLAAFRMRIGLNTGEALVGNVGSTDRFSYTAMGDAVNVASRLEGMNKQFGTTICVSETLVKAVEERIVVRPLRRIAVKGREERFMVYELLGVRDSEDPELKPTDAALALSELTRPASLLFEAGDYRKAAAAYRQILAGFPDDPVARAMLDECGQLADDATIA